MQLDYEWGYAYGAADVLSGESEFMLASTVRLDLTLTFLRRISTSDPDAHHVIVWDTPKAL